MGFEFREYQETAAQWWSTKRRALLISPPGSGKTVIAAKALHLAVIARERSAPVRVGWMCQSIDQKHQAHAAVDLIPDLLMRIDLRVECAAGGPDWSDRDVLIVDECQHSSAPGNRKSIETCKGAIWLMSATPFNGNDEQDDVIREMCRNTIHEIPVSAVKDKMADARFQVWPDTDANLQPLIDREIDKQMRAKRYMLKFVPHPQLWGQIAFQVCCDIGIVANKARNERIVELANASENVLVLIGRVEHGKALQERIKDSVLCHGGMTRKKRAETMQRARTGEIPRLVASSLADEGLDIPILSTLVMAAGGRNHNRMIQRAGRVLRKHEGKEFGHIHDFSDTWHPLAAKHARVRHEIFGKL